MLAHEGWIATQVYGGATIVDPQDIPVAHVTVVRPVGRRVGKVDGMPTLGGSDKLSSKLFASHRETTSQNRIDIGLNDGIAFGRRYIFLLYVDPYLDRMSGILLLGMQKCLMILFFVVFLVQKGNAINIGLTKFNPIISLFSNIKCLNILHGHGQ
jgi:hypothetical protein